MAEAAAVMPVEASEDGCMFECIEKVASVVAWTPSAELFFMKIMQGDEAFGFMVPGNAYHAYYLERVDVLRMRPRPLYNEKFCVSVL